MKSINKLLIALFIFFPLVSQAETLDYYTYGGFEVVRDTFIRMSLFFADSAFEGFIFVTAILSVVMGSIYFYTKQFEQGGGGNASPIGWLWPILIGGIIYMALIVPKGSLVVYDPTVNKFETVGNIPDFIVVMAGMTNKIERGITDISNASSAYPYGDEAGGLTFRLVLDTLTKPSAISNVHFSDSLDAYVKDCMGGQLKQSDQYANVQTHSLALETFLASYRNRAIFTTAYDGTPDEGETLSCWDAWETNLKPILNANTFETDIEATCKAQGIDPDDAAAKARCRTLMEKGVSHVFGLSTRSETMTARNFLKNKTIAHAIYSGLQQDSSDSLESILNKSVVFDGIGTGIAAGTWNNKIRAIVSTSVFAVITILFCFIATPWVWKVLLTSFGLLMFVAIWGAIDAMMHTSTMDASIAALDVIRLKGMTIETLLTSPPDILKSVSLMGKSRSMAITLAIMISGVLTGVSGYAFAQIGSAWQQDVDKKGEDAANQTLDPGQRGSMIQNIAGGMAAENNAASMGGMGNYAKAMEFNSGVPLMTADSTMSEGSRNGMGMNETMATVADNNAGQQFGAAMQNKQMAEQGGVSGVEMSTQISHASAEQNAASTIGRQNAYEDIAASEGGPTSDAIAENARLGTLSNDGSLKAVQDTFNGKDDKEGYTDHAGVSANETAGRLDATNQNPEILRTASQSSTAEYLGERAEVDRHAAAHGLTASDLGEVRGTEKVAEAKGKEALLDKNRPFDELAASHRQGLEKTVASAVSRDEIASEGGHGSTANLADKEATREQALSAGQAEVFEKASETLFDGDNATTGERIAGAHQSVVVTDSDLATASDNLKPGQAEAIQAFGGGVLNGAIDTDSGGFVSTNVNTGNSLNVDNSETIRDNRLVDSSDVVNTEVSSYSGVRVESGNQTSQQSLQNQLVNEDQRPELVSQFDSIQNNGDQDTRLNLVNAGNNLLSSVVARSNSDVEATNTSAGVGASAGVTASTPPGPVSANAGVNASASGSYTTSDTDTDSTSDYRPQLNNLIDESLWAGNTRAWNEVNEEHSNWTASEKEGYVEAKTTEYAADIYADKFAGLLDQAEQKSESLAIASGDQYESIQAASAITDQDSLPPSQRTTDYSEIFKKHE